MTSHVLDDRFLVSPATAVQGVLTQVNITPTERSNIYGSRRLQYKRFDLSTVPPIVLVRHDELFVKQLAARLQNHVLFKYRVLDRKNPAIYIPRFLGISPDDIVDNTIPALLTHTTATFLSAAPDNDFFIGRLTVMLTPS